MRVLVSALIQPPRIRRHGKEIARTPSESATPSSRSRSNGALEIGYHIMERPLADPAQRGISMTKSALRRRFDEINIS